MELRQLRYFLSVVDCRSFVSAADTLYISRQAVSKAISQLESELGTTLFVRGTNGAFLTPAGLMFYERVRDLVRELDNAAEEVRSSGSRFRQRIRIAFAPGTLALVEDRLLAFRDAKENLEIRYREHSQDQCVTLLEDRQADIILSSYRSQSHQFLSQKVLSSPLGILLQNTPLAVQLEQVDIQELSWIPLAIQEDEQLHTFCSKYQLEVRYYGQDFHRLFSLAAQGRCAVLLPECLIPRELTNLYWLPLQQEEYWTLYRTFPQTAQSSPLYSTVLEELMDQVLEI